MVFSIECRGSGGPSWALYWKPCRVQADRCRKRKGIVFGQPLNFLSTERGVDRFSLSLVFGVQWLGSGHFFVPDWQSCGPRCFIQLSTGKVVFCMLMFSIQWEMYSRPQCDFLHKMVKFNGHSPSRTDSRRLIQNHRLVSPRNSSPLSMFFFSNLSKKPMALVLICFDPRIFPFPNPRKRNTLFAPPEHHALHWWLLIDQQSDHGSGLPSGTV